MRKIIIGGLFLIWSIPFFSQTQQDNLGKYWHYRERLRNNFIYVSENVMDQGVNIPASDLDVKNSKLSWGDANNNMGHYLGMLATELWLLKKNNQDYSTTLKELYYAMLAMERLDLYSESMWSWYISHKDVNGKYQWVERDNSSFNPAIGNINGFSLRNDVTQNFWNQYQNHFGVKDFESSFMLNAGFPLEENSQDVIYHTMFGLALVAKLVDNESISGIPCDYWYNNINLLLYFKNRNIITLGDDVYGYPKYANFSLWAKDIIKRYIGYMQSNSTNYYGMLSTNWVLMNPVLGGLVQQGNGTGDSDFGTDLLSWGILKIGKSIVGENLRKDSSQCPVGYYNAAFTFSQLKDPDLIYTVSATGNYFDDNTFSYLRPCRDHCTYDPYNNNHTPICMYEHLALINLALFDPDYHIMHVNDEIYNNDKLIYERLLNIAPKDGPTTESVYEWSGTSRLIWPNKPLNTLDSMQFNGLDYMLLHNLYYITFRKEDFMTVNIDQNLFNLPKRIFSLRSGIIESSASVLGNNVQYTATRGITLKNGFSATSTGGKTFRGTIAPEDNYKAFDYKVVGDQSGSVRSLVKTVKQNQANSKDEEHSENSQLSDIAFYPNPSTGMITVNANEVRLPATLNITDTKGIVVFNEKLLTLPQQVNLSFLPRGIYLIRFFTSGTIETKRLILN